MVKEPDKETKQVIKDGKALSELVKSEGWQIIRGFLVTSVADISSLMGIKTNNPDELVKEIGARQIASECILNWLRRVENTADQYKANKPLIETDYILRIE